MIQRYILGFTVLLILGLLKVSAQQAIEAKWMHPSNEKKLADLNISYVKPSGFEQIGVGFDGIECFDNIPKLHFLLRCFGLRLDSDDGEVTLFIAPHPLQTKVGHDRHNATWPDMPLGNFNLAYHANIKAEIKQLKGANASKNWKNYATYYANREAKQKFNADTAIIVELPLELKPEEYYRGKLKYLRVLIIRKNDVGHIPVYCFYSEKAQKRMPYYWRSIEKMLRFK